MSSRRLSTLFRPTLLGLGVGLGVAGLALASEPIKVRAATGPRSTALRLLDHQPDTYRGVVIEQAALDDKSASEFGEALAHSCERWSEEGKRGIWLHVPLEQADLVPEATARGFRFHHASSSVLTLVRWLPPSPCTLPPGPAFQVGVGAFVLNADKAVLMVKERSGPAAKHGIWKVPTGLVDPGEDLFDAVRREVLEETGVRTTDDGAQILSIRHAHPSSPGGVSDLFVMISLQLDPAIDGADGLRIQESEIAEARWMPLDELSALTYYTPGGLLHEMVLAAAAEGQSGFSGRRHERGDRPAAHVYRSRL